MMAHLTHCLLFWPFIFVSVLFVLVHLATSANMLSSVPCRRQKKLCLLWCFWHPTRGDRRGCESCCWDFHGDRSIRRRYKQHNPSLRSGMCMYVNNSRNSMLVNNIRASSAKERFSRAFLIQLWWQWWFLYCCFPDVRTWGCTVTTSSEPSQTAGTCMKSSERGSLTFE